MWKIEKIHEINTEKFLVKVSEKRFESTADYTVVIG